jgi:conjugative relaxase-like TrwC/TraI family protein
VLGVHGGYDVGYLTNQVGTGRENYYLSAVAEGGEPPGFWAGKGAADLGLQGQVDPETMRNLYHNSITPDGEQIGRKPYNYEAMKARVAGKVEAQLALEPYATDKRKAELYNQELSRVSAPVSFFDLTYSAPKSVSLSHAGYLAAAERARCNGDIQAAEAYQAKADGIIDALKATALKVTERAEAAACYTRTGHNGVEHRDGKGMIAALFVQHTSRDGDPQLHVHGAYLNLVQRADAADQKYRTLDSRAIYAARLGMSADADLTLSQELARRGLPLVQRIDGNGFEVAGITQDTMDAFSSRSSKITPEVARLVSAYEDKHGRQPSRHALWSMKQHATLATRAPKSHEVPTPAQELAAWEAKSQAAEVQLLADLPDAIHHASQAAPVPALPDAARDRAMKIGLAEVQRQHATWTASHLRREIAMALPQLPARTDPTPLLDDLVREVITNLAQAAEVVPLTGPEVANVALLGVRDSDGQPVHKAPGAVRYATADQLDIEEFLLEDASRKVDQALSHQEASEALDGTDLTANQREAAAGLLAATRAVSVFVGPAGTGKSHTMAAFAKIYEAATGQRVIGLTSATNAARVLQGEGLARSFNIADFLGKLKGTTETRGNLPVCAGDVLVIDEASQLTTADLAAIQTVARNYGARVILSGDTEQLTSPDAGGAMRLIAREHGYWQLTEVRRFRNTWEGPASLRLREGDSASLDHYQRNGRIREGSAADIEDSAVKHWLGDHLAGKDSLLLTTSNDQATKLAAMAREELVKLGKVADRTDAVLSDSNAVSTGDIIRARDNRRDIKVSGVSLANRDILKITGWQGHGSRRKAVVTRQELDGKWSAPFGIPEKYLAEHGELSYAGNTHVAEGKTVDTGHLVVSESTNRESLYVGITRGRESNTAYVITSRPSAADLGGIRPAPELTEAVSADEAEHKATAQSVLSGALARDSDNLTATEVMRTELDTASSMPHLHELWLRATRPHVFAAYEEAAKESLSPGDYERFSNDPEKAVLQRALRSAEMSGHDSAQILRDACQREMSGANSIAAVIHGRIEAMDLPQTAAPDSYLARTPVIDDPEHNQLAQDIATALDNRVTYLGQQAASQPPLWAERYLGEVPQDPVARQEWTQNAGQAESVRELTRYTDPAEALGSAPAGGAAEALAAHRQASAAIGLTDPEQEIRECSDGELESRTLAYEREMTWAPAYVAEDLRTTSMAEADTKAESAIAWAQAEKSADMADILKAAGYDALAETLSARKADLAEIDQAYDAWHLQTDAKRQAASTAATEQVRRDPASVPPPAASQGSAATDDLSALVDSARQAQAKISAEAEAATQAAENDADERRSADHWRDLAASRDSATWQPGRAEVHSEADLADW